MTGLSCLLYTISIMCINCKEHRIPDVIYLCCKRHRDAEGDIIMNSCMCTNRHIHIAYICFQEWSTQCLSLQLQKHFRCKKRRTHETTSDWIEAAANLKAWYLVQPMIKVLVTYCMLVQKKHEDKKGGQMTSQLDLEVLFWKAS